MYSLQRNISHQLQNQPKNRKIPQSWGFFALFSYFLFMEKHEYEDDTVPHPVAKHQRDLIRERAVKALDDQEMREIESYL